MLTLIMSLFYLNLLHLHKYNVESLSLSQAFLESPTLPENFLVLDTLNKTLISTKYKSLVFLLDCLLWI